MCQGAEHVDGHRDGRESQSQGAVFKVPSAGQGAAPGAAAPEEYGTGSRARSNSTVHAKQYGNPIGNPIGNTIGNTIGNSIGNTIGNKKIG